MKQFHACVPESPLTLLAFSDRVTSTLTEKNELLKNLHILKIHLFIILYFSLWSIMKNCIGKDLSRIPVPVNFSEPLSMLQRMSEDLQYSDILDKAAQCQDDCEQLAYVAAFTVSAFGSTAIRTGKPFNPLLGETFELDRSDDLGFKLISEQVSHHPPMLAQHCENIHGHWKTWQEFTMRSKFKGKYLEVEPLGITHLEFPKSGNHYTWRKVKTIVHNIVIGKVETLLKMLFKL